MSKYTQKRTDKLLKLFEGKKETELFESKIVDSDEKHEIINNFFKKTIK